MLLQVQLQGAEEQLWGSILLPVRMCLPCTMLLHVAWSWV